ncbi:MAG: DUF177 domain-containing protein [Eubacteriales bacterium]
MLDLTRIINGETKRITFEREYPVSDLSADILSGFALVKGFCEIRADSSDFIDFHADFCLSLNVICARCGGEFDTKLEFSLFYPVAAKLTNPDKDQDEYLILEDGKLDIDEISRTAMILNLPVRFLCGDDCEGLCPFCGADLNKADCGCDFSAPDPRLRKLKEYFNKEKNKG